MNRQITRLAVAALTMMIVLVLGTTYWQTWASAGLADRKENAIQRVAQFTIERGWIYASDMKTVLARNQPQRVSGRTLYFRRYPAGGLAAHVVGYSTQTRSRAGLEQSMNDYLVGANANLSTVIETTKNRLTGATIEGNDLKLTLVAKAQQAALDALGDRCGAVVALEPASGKVLVMASSPTYDPGLIEKRFGAVERITGGCRQPAALLNRATYGLYIPGSTFKLVTLAAALESGRWNESSTFVDPGYCTVYEKRVNNYDTNRPFGRVTLRESLKFSINSVFCNIGKELGAKKIVEQSKKFGFYSVPPLETPVNERLPSGLYDDNDLFDPKDDFQVDPGRFAFGQERLLVTPLQMAMVAATVANGGTVMRPYVVDRVIGPKGAIVTRTKPEELGRALKARHAATIASFMIDAVAGGTGTAAQLGGFTVGGKTGTAETGVEGRNTTWFVSFAGRERPQVAIAVVVEEQSGTGGSTAAPVAKTVLQAILGSGANT